MVVDEKVEPCCLSGKRVEQVLILCYHQGWDNRSDCIVREIDPVEFVPVVNEFQIFQTKIIIFHLPGVTSLIKCRG